MISIVIPAKNEKEEIIATLIRIKKYVTINFECLIVVDSADDSTTSTVKPFVENDARFKVLISNLPPGPGNAIKFGMNSSIGDCIIVTMADGCDDISQIDKMYDLISRGVSVVNASRYMKGGQQLGSSGLKPILSKFAGLSLYYLARIQTKDSTNSFKAYSKNFINNIEIDSGSGFELGLQLVIKAKKQKLLIAEIPTIWIERHLGTSKFKLYRWLPNYIYWYLYAFKIGK